MDTCATTNHPDAHKRYTWHHQFISYIKDIIASKQVVTIATHDGAFHADEVMAVTFMALAIQALGGRWEVKRLNRRSPAVGQAHICIDIGRTFDPACGRFDHHQPGGAGRRAGRDGMPDIPYSSCGLVWHSCGLILTCEAADYGILPGGRFPLTQGFDKIDRELVRGVDASDNALIMPNGYMEKVGDSQLHHSGAPLHLSRMLGQFNRPNQNDTMQYVLFMKALGVAKLVAENALFDAKRFLQERAAIRTALADHAATRQTPYGVLTLPGDMRWAEHLPYLPLAGHIRVVLSPVGDGSWKIGTTRNGNLRAPPPWRGLEGAELQAASGLQGLTFCHDSGCMLRAATYEDALACARRLLGN